MNARTRRHTPRAFTLIELLVVIAIIVALLAILMPSMNKAIEAATRAACGSNIHQLSVATLAYAADSRGAMPADPDQYNGNWMWDLTRNMTDALVSRGGSKNDVFYDPALPEHSADVHWTYDAQYRVTGYWFTFRRLNGPMAGIAQLDSGHPWLTRISQPAGNHAPLTLAACATLSDNFQFTPIYGGSPIPHVSPHMDAQGEFPDGGSVGGLDGSVQWRDYNDMKIQLSGPQQWF